MSEGKRKKVRMRRRRFLDRREKNGSKREAARASETEKN